MNTIVTGGAGFIGSHLTDALLDRGDTVTIVDDLSTGRRNLVNPRARFIERDAATIPTLMGIDTVFHLAAQTSVVASMRDPHDDLRRNATTTLRVAQLAKQANARLVIVSTGGAMYDPTHPTPWPETAPAAPVSAYGISKLTAEHYALRFGPPNTTILRLANIYGPRQNPHGEAGVIAIFIENALHGRPLNIYGDGFATRDYLHVTDAVAAILTAATLPGQNLLNAGTGQPTTTNTIATTILDHLPEGGAIHYHPARPGELTHSTLDATRLRTHGWNPTITIENGIRSTLEATRQ